MQGINTGNTMHNTTGASAPRVSLPNIHNTWYLVLGVVLLFATHLNHRIIPLAWISGIPFLLYLGKTSGFRSRLLFFLALNVAWALITAKIISPPMPYFFVFLFSVPISLVHLPGYLLWARMRDNRWRVFVFPAAMILMEWIQYTFTPFASWGVAAYTQAGNLPVMQVLSVFGMPGLSFLIYWVNSSAAGYLLNTSAPRIRLLLPLAAVALVFVAGSLRFSNSRPAGKATIAVAAVGTDSEVSGLPLPSAAENKKVQEGLFRRTRKAAGAGAQLVVWNEASTFILPADEKRFTDSLQHLAGSAQIYLVAAFVVPVSQQPLRYQNKYLFVNPEGQVLQTYNKHQPVPGEPAERGTEPLVTWNINQSRVGAAICYDYDFPYMAKGFGQADADIVALPSSDWRGIDPLHTEMAAFRATEQGHSVLRATRFGLSAAITPYGELTVQQSSFDAHDKIMYANLPVKGIPTIYGFIGDLFVYCCISGLAVILIMAFRNRKSAGPKLQ